MKKVELPPRVHIKHGAYYLVHSGKPRRWERLSHVSDGINVMYRALAERIDGELGHDKMPVLVAKWLKEVSVNRSAKTQANDEYQCRDIAAKFRDFRADQVHPPDVAAFLKPLRKTPRSHNAYRAMLRELMRFAEELGLRKPGSNPVDSIRTMSIKARDRYITDSELRRIKIAAMYGDDDKRTQSGRMICTLIDVAYLTGQRISDLLGLEWEDVRPDGILFQPGKLEASTGAKVLIEWTPRLRDAIRRLKEMKLSRPGASDWIFVSRKGERYTYSGASTAWKRALKRSGVSGCTFHDLRAKAITDKDEREGIGSARRMGAHSTESQTADYIRHKKALRTAATR